MKRCEILYFYSQQDAALKYELDNYERNRWIHIGSKIGMTPAGCKRRAAEMNFRK